MKLRRGLFFVLPWLIILLVPQLRAPARMAIVGSEYIGPGSEDYLQPDGVLSPGWLPPTPPTLTELWRNAGNDRQAQVAVLLKAPQQSSDEIISLTEARRRFTRVLQIAPRDPALLASALQLVADCSAERAVPPFASDNFFDSTGPSFNTLPSGILAAGSNANSDSAIWADDFMPMKWPPAVPPLEDIEVSYAQPVIEPSAMAITPIGGSTPTTPIGPATGFAPISLVFDKIYLFHGPMPLGAATRRHTQAALQWARRGGAMEPDNAYWDWAMVGFYYAARRDAEALKALHRAAQKPHYDAHLDFVQRAALRTAELHRPLLTEEKINVWERQFGEDNASNRRTRLVMWSLLSAKRSGETAQALSIAADAARFAALMQHKARTSEQLNNGFMLQSAAWAAIGGPVMRKNSRPKRRAVAYYAISTSLSSNGQPRTTPLDFARQFASAARRAKRADLATEALQQAREATPRQLKMLREPTYWLHDGIAPQVWAPLRLLHSAARIALEQSMLLAPVWLLACFLLWPPLGKLARPATRLWRRFIIAWRGEVVYAAPPTEEPGEIMRDVRITLWLSAVFTALFGAVALWCAPGTDLPEKLWPPRGDYVQARLGFICTLGVLLTPLACAFLWNIFAPLRRLVRLWRQSLPSRQAKTPASLKPYLWAFVAWSAVFYAALSWILAVLAETNIFNLSNYLDGFLPYWENLKFDFLAQEYRRLCDFGDWASDFVGAAWLTGAAIAIWLLKWHVELAPTWRWSALHAALQRLRRTSLAWLPITGWLFLILLLAALPYRRNADAQFQRQIAHPQMLFHPISSGE